MPKHLTTNDSASFVAATAVGAASGVAPLGSDSKIPATFLPDVGAGTVNSVNGKTGTVLLTASDVGSVAANAVGNPNGVAPLDATGRLPISKLPTSAVQTVNGYTGPSVTLAASDLGAISQATADSRYAFQDSLYYNAKNHGAVIDGTTDDAPAINALLSSVPAGATVYLPQGDVAVGSPIVVPPGKTLRGPRRNLMKAGLYDPAVRIKPLPTFTGPAVIQFLDQATGGYSAISAEQRVENLMIYGANAPAGVDGIQAKGNVQNVELNYVTIREMTGNGIYTGVNAGAYPYSWRLFKVMLDNNHGHGASFQLMTDLTMIDCQAIGNWSNGFVLNNAANSQLSTCRAEWNGNHGYYITGSWGTGQGSGGMQMTGCATDRNGYNGVFVDATGNGPIVISNLMTRRDGRNGGTGNGGYAGLAATNATTPLVIGDWTNYPGTDDNGSGTNSPMYGGSFTGNTSVQIDNAYLHANTAGINDGGGNALLQLGSNVAYATGTTASPTRSLATGYEVVVAASNSRTKKGADFVCTGTNDQAVIQQAINLVNAAPGKGVVRLMDGTFNLGATISIPNGSGLSLIGSGSGTVLKVANGTNIWAMTFAGPNDTRHRFANFTIDGNCLNQTTGGGGIYAVGAVWCVFEYIHFTSCWQAGLYLGPQPVVNAFGHNNSITRCLFDQSINSSGLGQGIYLTSNDENQIQHCDFEYLGGAGAGTAAAILDLAGTQQIVSCNFVNGGNNAYGIRCQDAAANTKIVACNFDGMAGDCVFLATTNCVVSDCTFFEIGIAGVAGNASGIHLEYAAQNNSIHGNTLASSATNGQTRSLIREENIGGSGNNFIFGNTLITKGTMSVGALDLNAPNTVVRLNKGGGTAGDPADSRYPLKANLALNVKDYGAKGDGVANDLSAIQASIAAIPSTGGTLYFPAGTYAINGGAIELPSYVRVMGDGVRATRIIQNSTTAHAFHAVDVSYVTIENLRIVGPNSGTGIGIFFETSAAPNNYITLRNVNVQTFGGHGISIQRSIVSLIQEVVSQGHGGHGFDINDGTSMSVVASYALSNQQAGYNILSMAYCSLSGCGADSNGIGYLLDTSQGVTLSGCGCEVPVNRSTSYPGIAYKITGGFSNALLSCVNFDNLIQAVLITGNSVNNTVTNFDENSPTGSAVASIQVDTGSRATVIAPNVVTATVYNGDVTAIGGLARNDFIVSGSTVGVRATTKTGSGTNTQALFQARGADSSNTAFQAQTTTDAVGRFGMLVDGSMTWGPGGSAARDVNWKRRSVGVLGTDNALQAITGFQLGSSATDFGGGVGVLGMKNAATVPTTNPTGGVVVYPEGGVLKVRQPDGTVVFVRNIFTNVKDYGAVGDGVADDTAAIQAAITALGSQGGVVYLPPGNYLLNGANPINLAAPVTLQGAGHGATTIRIGASFTGSSAITISSDDCMIQGLQLRGVSTTTTSNPACHGVTATGVQETRIFDTTFQWINGYALRLFGTASTTLHGTQVSMIKIQSCAGGIHIKSDSTATAANVQLSNIFTRFLGVSSGTNANLDGLRIEDSWDILGENILTWMNATTGGTGAAFRVTGDCAAIFIHNLDALGPQTGVANAVIEDNASGKSPQNVQISGGVIQQGLIGLLVSGGSNQIRVRNVRILHNQTHNVSITSSGYGIYLDECLISQGGDGATGTNYDVNWTGSAEGFITDCRFGSDIVATGTAGVQGIINISSAVVRVINANFMGSGSSSANWFPGIAPQFTSRVDGTNMEMRGNLDMIFAAGQRLSLRPNASGNNTLAFNVGGTAVNDNFRLLGDGTAQYGIGSSARDTTWGRQGTAQVGTPDSDIVIGLAGKGLRIKEGTNARMGQSTLASGTVTVSNTSVTANTRIFLSRKSTSGTPGFLTYTVSAGTSFTITSSSGTDASTVEWFMVEKF
jgi:hypothetical protein